MPAVFHQQDFFDNFLDAIRVVCQGARKVEGDGYKVYRIGATIRCDLSPHWISEPDPAPEKASNLTGGLLRPSRQPIDPGPCLEEEEGSEGQQEPLSKHFPVWPPTKGDGK